MLKFPKFKQIYLIIYQGLGLILSIIDLIYWDQLLKLIYHFPITPTFSLLSTYSLNLNQLK